LDTFPYKPGGDGGSAGSQLAAFFKLHSMTGVYQNDFRGDHRAYSSVFCWENELERDSRTEGEMHGGGGHGCRTAENVVTTDLMHNPPHSMRESHQGLPWLRAGRKKEGQVGCRVAGDGSQPPLGRGAIQLPSPSLCAETCVWRVSDSGPSARPRPFFPCGSGRGHLLAEIVCWNLRQV